MRHSRNPARERYLGMMHIARSARRKIVQPIVDEINAEIWKGDTPAFGLDLLLSRPPKPDAVKATFYDIAKPQCDPREMHNAFKRLRQRGELFVARNGCA